MSVPDDNFILIVGAIAVLAYFTYSRRRKSSAARKSNALPGTRPVSSQKPALQRLHDAVLDERDHRQQELEEIQQKEHRKKEARARIEAEWPIWSSRFRDAVDKVNMTLDELQLPRIEQEAAAPTWEYVSNKYSSEGADCMDKCYGLTWKLHLPKSRRNIVIRTALAGDAVRVDRLRFKAGGAEHSETIQWSEATGEWLLGALVALTEDAVLENEAYL